MSVNVIPSQAIRNGTLQPGAVHKMQSTEHLKRGELSLQPFSSCDACCDKSYCITTQKMIQKEKQTHIGMPRKRKREKENQHNVQCRYLVMDAYFLWPRIDQMRITQLPLLVLKQKQHILELFIAHIFDKEMDLFISLATFQCPSIHNL